MTLKNVQIVGKGERPQYGEKAVYDLSSDVTVFNLYEQQWQALVDAGLSYLFNEDRAEFEYRKYNYENKDKEVTDKCHGKATSKSV